jgi:hypothetical protein
MKLRTDTAASLTGYLRACECVVEVIDPRVIDATARPQSFAAPYADIELEGVPQRLGSNAPRIFDRASNPHGSC